jgi:S1-C subfamily serine protease
LGFAVPSNTILREITALITTGSYSGHSYLGVTGSDMSYDTAQEIGSSVTYGWRLASVVSGGPSDGKLQVDDIIIAMNDNLIRNNDVGELSGGEHVGTRISNHGSTRTSS